MVRFIDNDDISDFKQARLDRLNTVSKSRRLYDDHRVGKRRDIGAVLTCTNGLDNYQWVADSIQQVNQAGGRPGETALAAATGHAPYKGTIVRMAFHHANAISKNRSARNRT